MLNINEYKLMKSFFHFVSSTIRVFRKYKKLFSVQYKTI